MLVLACLVRPVQLEGVVSLVSRVQLVVQVMLAETQSMARMEQSAKWARLVLMAQTASRALVGHPARRERKVTQVIKLRTSCRPTSTP